VNPPLTRIDLPAETMGYQAGKMLVQKLMQPTEAVMQTLVPPVLCLQTSTSPVK
jgi:DNA-binding LacI/PurR family transcriptional regulator